MYGQGAIYKINPANQQLTLVYSFGATRADGKQPVATLLQAADGNFYGTTSLGGSGKDKAGTIFKMTLEGIVSVLYTFHSGNPQNGATPIAPLIQGSDGNFYGTTASGGANNLGTVFKMTPKYTVTILHSFGKGKDGRSPGVALVQATNGLFYGTTAQGGIAGKGIVYRIAKDGTYTVLHNFDDGSIADDGASPAAPLTLGPDGFLYGTTSSQASGGLPLGTVYRISP